jgi:uncharacterized protein YndB with AHSA1/START domain
MSSAQRIEPIRKEIYVEAPQERAFRVFTTNIEAWWPKDHHIGKAALKQAVLEPKVGGRWYEIGVDGSECEWGKVLSWEPPRRIVLAWSITAAWQYDPAFVTELEITFTAQGAKRTHVQLEHRNLERFGDAAEQVRTMLEPGWAHQLGLFAGFAAAD